MVWWLCSGSVGGGTWCSGDDGGVAGGGVVVD